VCSIQAITQEALKHAHTRRWLAACAVKTRDVPDVKHLQIQNKLRLHQTSCTNILTSSVPGTRTCLSMYWAMEPVVAVPLIQSTSVFYGWYMALGVVTLTVAPDNSCTRKDKCTDCLPILTKPGIDRALIGAAAAAAATCWYIKFRFWCGSWKAQLPNFVSVKDGSSRTEAVLTSLNHS